MTSEKARSLVAGAGVMAHVAASKIELGGFPSAAKRLKELGDEIAGVVAMIPLETTHPIGDAQTVLNKQEK